MLNYHSSEYFFLCLTGNIYLSVCACCLLCCRCTVLKKVWLHLLYSLPARIYGHLKDPTDLPLLQADSSQLSQPCLEYKIPLVIFRVLCRTGSTMVVSSLYWGAQSCTFNMYFLHTAVQPSVAQKYGFKTFPVPQSVFFQGFKDKIFLREFGYFYLHPSPLVHFNEDVS